MWVGGEHYELDCLIYASGFEVGTAFARRGRLRADRPRRPDAVGALGRRACRACTASTCTASRTCSSSASTQGANLISNVPHNLTDAGTTIAAVVAHAEAIGADEVEVTAEAEQRWVAADRGDAAAALRQPRLHARLLQQRGPGAGRQAMLELGGYPEGPVAYFQYIDAWRTSGDFDGLEFR